MRLHQLITQQDFSTAPSYHGTSFSKGLPLGCWIPSALHRRSLTLPHENCVAHIFGQPIPGNLFSQFQINTPNLLNQSVSVSFFAAGTNTWHTQFKREKIYFVKWFQGFWSMVSQLQSYNITVEGVAKKAAHGVGEQCAGKQPKRKGLRIRCSHTHDPCRHTQNWALPISWASLKWIKLTTNPTIPNKPS